MDKDTREQRDLQLRVAELERELSDVRTQVQLKAAEVQSLRASLEAARLEAQRTDDQLRQAQKMEAVGRLAGSMAHDYNNLLTSILGYSELLMDFLPEGDPLIRNVEGIVKAAERAAVLTEQIQTFKRKQVVQTRALYLNTIIADLDKMLRRMLSEHIQLELALEPTLGAIEADASQLKQVVLNLAINARNMMPQGGKLIIETANTDLDTVYAGKHEGLSPGRYVRLAISDTGAGLDPEELAQLFVPSAESHERDQEAGMGLASVYNIVQQSGGHIMVYSELDQGTTFKVYFPRQEAPPAAVPVPSAAAQPSALPQGTETILLAEDNEDIRNLVCATLQSQGYTVISARDGAEALELGRASVAAIDLVLTDVVMPHKNGNEVALELLQLKPGLKVIYMSGYTDNAIVHHNEMEPGSAYLPKPFTLDVLSHKVRELLNRNTAP